MSEPLFTPEGEPVPSDDRPEHPRIIVVTPYYGPISMGLHHALQGAVKDRDELTVVKEAQASSSVLPHCFNMLLGLALDARDMGEVSHMAMLHADVVPKKGWLNDLWREMWFHNLDAVSAVVPIKGTSGRTSTAVGSTEDRWKVKRCVYLKDRDARQTAIRSDSMTGDDVLLINTGCMLIDLRRDYWNDFAFEFHARIKRTAQGRLAESRSEDWEMSHHLHQHGARYGATWAVKLCHEGGGKFHNYDVDEN